MGIDHNLSALAWLRRLCFECGPCKQSSKHTETKQNNMQTDSERLVGFFVSSNSAFEIVEASVYFTCHESRRTFEASKLFGIDKMLYIVKQKQKNRKTSKV